MSEMTREAVEHYLRRLIKKYSTGWLLNEIGGAGVADWQNVHLGTDPTGDNDVIHNLNLHHIEDAIISVFVSSDGTEANAVTLTPVNRLGAAADYGWASFYVDADRLIIQTATGGLAYLDTNGVVQLLTNQAWYYNVSVFEINCVEH